MSVLEMDPSKLPPSVQAMLDLIAAKRRAHG